MRISSKNAARGLKLWLTRWLMLAILGHFTFGVLEQSAYVLCFGADGHVAVERAGHEHRAPTTEQLPAPSQGKTALHSAGLPCIDIPVAGDDHSSHSPFPAAGKDFGNIGSLLALAAFCFILLPLIRLSSPALRAQSPPLLDSRILLRRSVVLLI
ncbi:MAG: hypothetical protein U1E83_01995 [Methylotetracoccus sp.]